jgi:hypothetical protein
MHLIEDNLAGMADTPESSYEGQDSDDNKTNLVFGLALGSSPLSAGLSKLVKLNIGIEIVVVGGLL